MMPAMEFDTTILVISWSAVYFFTSHPFVFINSTSEPKFSAMMFSFVYISFVTASAVYSDVLLFSEFIIFTTESAVNSPDDFSSIVTDAFDSSIDANDIFLSLNSCIFSTVSSAFINSILSVYMHSSLFFS